MSESDQVADGHPKKDKRFLSRLQFLEKRLEKELEDAKKKSSKEKLEEFNQN